MGICNICPRNCNIDRSEKIGYCAMTDTVKISRAALHMWEEPCISGEKGSGTVFFSGCNMKCVFCQNKDISTDGFGKEITIGRLAEIFLELQDKGALNINLVTPTHYTLQIIDAVKNIDDVQEKYKEKYDLFREKYCAWEDGHASEKVVEAVFNK